MASSLIYYLSSEEQDYSQFLRACTSCTISVEVRWIKTKAAFENEVRVAYPDIVIADLSHRGFPALSSVKHITKFHPSILTAVVSNRITERQAATFRSIGLAWFAEKTPAFYAQLDHYVNISIRLPLDSSAGLQSEPNKHSEALNDCLLSFTNNPRSNIQKLVNLCGQLLKPQRAGYHRFRHQETEQLAEWPSSGKRSSSRLNRNDCYNLLQQEKKDPFFINADEASHSSATAAPQSRGQAVSIVGARVGIDGRVVGALCAHFPVRPELSRAELSMLQKIAAAIAVEERRLAQVVALQESEERYHLLSEISFGGLCIHQGGVIIEANQPFANLVGYSREELINRPVVDLVAPESRMQVLAKIKSGFEGVYRAKGIRKDGSIYPVEVYGRDCRYRGMPARVTAIRDISLQVGFENDLKEQLAVAQALNAVAEVIIREDQSAGILNRTVKIIGEALAADQALIYEVDFVKGKAVGLCQYRAPGDFHPPSAETEYDLSYFRETSRYLKAAGSYLESHIDDMDARLLKDRAARLIHQQMNIKSLLWFPLLFREGGFYLLVLNQFTHRRNWSTAAKDFLQTALSHVSLALMKSEMLRESLATEQALRNSEEKYRRIFEKSRDVIFISTPGGRFLDINPAGVELLGYTSKAELLQIDIGDKLYVIPEQRETLKESLEKHGFVKDFRSVIKSKSGRHIIVLENINAIRDADGNTVAYEGIMRDITEQQKLETQLLQAHKMEAMGKLASGIAHDFNNILAAILGNTEISLQLLNPGSQVYENLAQIHKAGERARRLVGQILSYTHQTELKMLEVPVRQILEEALELLRASIPPTIHIATEFGEEELTILGDPTQMHQVFMNICANACQAMPDQKGSLAIRLEKLPAASLPLPAGMDLKTDDYVKIAIVDDGVGMEENVLARIFDPFFTTKVKGQGTGMGLSVAQGIIQRHQGFIEVHSKPGEGTTVLIYLPCQTSAVSQKTAKTPLLPTGEGHILFVDDEEALADVGRQILQLLGYTVTTEINSKRALERFRSQPAQYDLVITDQIMPSLTGLEMAREMLTIRPETPIILMSGFSDLVTRRKAIEMGIRDYITKPIATMTLGSTIQQVLKQN